MLQSFTFYANANRSGYKNLNNETQTVTHTHYIPWLLGLYVVLIVYGTLYPLSGWNTELGGFQELLQLKWPTHFSRGDVLVNFVVYLPLGYLIGLLLTSGHQYRIIAITTLCGFLLCSSLEYAQTYLPNRVPSLLDILLNTIGSLVGSLLSILLGFQSNFTRVLIAQKRELFLPTALTNLVILTAVFWMLAQLAPLVPSPDIGNLRAGLRPIWAVIQNPASFNFKHFINYTLNFAGLGILLIAFNRPHHPMLGKMIIFMLVVLVLKIPIVDRSLSFEAVFGLICAIPLWLLLDVRSSKIKGLLIIACLLLAYMVEGLSSDSAAKLQLLHPMNWIPFRHQMGDVVGLVDLVLSIWPFMALAAAVLMIKQAPSNFLILLSIVLVALFSYTIERAQLRLVGRYADITDVLMATASFAWCIFHYRTSSYVKPDYDYSIVGKMIE